MPNLSRTLFTISSGGRASGGRSYAGHRLVCHNFQGLARKFLWPELPRTKPTGRRQDHLHFPPLGPCWFVNWAQWILLLPEINPPSLFSIHSYFIPFEARIKYEFLGPNPIPLFSPTQTQAIPDLASYLGGWSS